MPVRHIYRGGMESMEQSCLFMLESGDPRMDEEKLSRRETSCVFLYDQGSNSRSLHDVNLYDIARREVCREYPGSVYDTCNLLYLSH